MATQHGRARSKNKITHNCCNFGVMGGLAPVTGRPNAHIASRSANRNPVPCNLDCDKARKWLAGDNPLGKNMLSVNPTYSGGVGFLKKSNRKCNCGSSPPEGVQGGVANTDRFYVIVLSSAPKPVANIVNDYWSEHYDAYLRQIHLLGNRVLGTEFIWFGTPIQDVRYTSTNIQVTYGEGTLTEYDALQAQQKFLTEVLLPLNMQPLLILSTFDKTSGGEELVEPMRQALSELAKKPLTNVVTYHSTQRVSDEVIGFHGDLDNHGLINNLAESILEHANNSGWISSNNWAEYLTKNINTILITDSHRENDNQSYTHLRKKVTNLSKLSVIPDNLKQIEYKKISRALSSKITDKISFITDSYETTHLVLSWIHELQMDANDLMLFVLKHNDDIQELMDNNKDIIKNSFDTGHIQSFVSALAVGAYDLVHYENTNTPRPYQIGNDAVVQTSTYKGSPTPSKWPDVTNSFFYQSIPGSLEYYIAPGFGIRDEWIGTLLNIWAYWLNSSFPPPKTQDGNDNPAVIFFCNDDIINSYDTVPLLDGGIYTLRNNMLATHLFDTDNPKTLFAALVERISKSPGGDSEEVCKIGDIPIYYPDSTDTLTLDDMTTLIKLIEKTASQATGPISNTKLCFASLSTYNNLTMLIAPKHIDYAKTSQESTDIYTLDEDLLYNANSGLDMLDYIGENLNDTKHHHLNNILPAPIVDTFSTSANQQTMGLRYQFEYHYDTSGNKRWSQLSEPLITSNFSTVTVPPDVIHLVTSHMGDVVGIGVRWYLCHPIITTMGYLGYEYKVDVSSLDDFIDNSILQWTVSYDTLSGADILSVRSTEPFPIFLDSIVTNNDTDHLLKKDDEGNTVISNIINNKPYLNQHVLLTTPPQGKTLKEYINDRYGKLTGYLSYGTVIPQRNPWLPSIFTNTNFKLIPHLPYNSDKFKQLLLPYDNNSDHTSDHTDISLQLPIFKDPNMDIKSQIKLLSEAIYYTTNKYLVWIDMNDVKALREKYSFQADIKWLNSSDYNNKLYANNNIGDMIDKINFITDNMPNYTDDQKQQFKEVIIPFYNHKLAALSVQSIYQLYTIEENHGVYSEMTEDEINDLETLFNELDGTVELDSSGNIVDSSGVYIDILSPSTFKFQLMVQEYKGKIKQITFCGLPAYFSWGFLGDAVDAIGGAVSGAATAVYDVGKSIISASPASNVLFPILGYGLGVLRGNHNNGGVLSHFMQRSFLAGVLAAANPLLGVFGFGLSTIYLNWLHMNNPTNDCAKKLFEEGNTGYLSKYDNTVIGMTPISSFIISRLVPKDTIISQSQWEELTKQYSPNKIGIGQDFNLEDSLVNLFKTQPGSSKPKDLTFVLETEANYTGAMDTFDPTKRGDSDKFPYSLTIAAINTRHRTVNSQTLDKCYSNSGQNCGPTPLMYFKIKFDDTTIPSDSGLGEDSVYYGNNDPNSISDKQTKVRFVSVVTSGRKMLYNVNNVFSEGIIAVADQSYKLREPGGGYEKDSNDETGFNLLGGGEITTSSDDYPPQKYLDSSGNVKVPDASGNDSPNNKILFESSLSRVFNVTSEDSYLCWYPANLASLTTTQKQKIYAAYWLGPYAGADWRTYVNSSGNIQYKDLASVVDADGTPSSSFSTCNWNSAIALLIQPTEQAAWTLFQLVLNTGNNPATYGWKIPDDVKNINGKAKFNDRMFGLPILYDTNNLTLSETTSSDSRTVLKTRNRKTPYDVKSTLSINCTFTNGIRVNNKVPLDIDLNILTTDNSNKRFTFLCPYAADSDIINSCDKRYIKWGQSYDEIWRVPRDILKGKNPVQKPHGPRAMAKTRAKFRKDNSVVNKFPVISDTPDLRAAQPFGTGGGGGGGNPYFTIYDKKSGDHFKVIRLTVPIARLLINNLAEKYPWTGDSLKEAGIEPSLISKEQVAREDARNNLRLLANDSSVLDNTDIYAVCADRRVLFDTTDGAPLRGRDGSWTDLKVLGMFGMNEGEISKLSSPPVWNSGWEPSAPPSDVIPPVRYADFQFALSFWAVINGGGAGAMYGYPQIPSNQWPEGAEPSREPPEGYTKTDDMFDIIEYNDGVGPALQALTFRLGQGIFSVDSPSDEEVKYLQSLGLLEGGEAPYSGYYGERVLNNLAMCQTSYARDQTITNMIPGSILQTGSSGLSHLETIWQYCSDRGSYSEALRRVREIFIRKNLCLKEEQQGGCGPGPGSNNPGTINKT